MKPVAHWGRVFGEVMLIVVGVLLAFAIESRWQDRQESSRQRSYLASVSEELERNREQLRAYLERVESSGRAADSLLSLGAEVGEVPIATINDLLWRSTFLGAVQVSTIALDELLSSTVWADLDNPALQYRLAKIEGAVRTAESWQQVELTYWFGSFDPYLRTRLDYEEHAQRRAVPVGGWSAMLDDIEFRNLITHSRWLLAESARRAQGILTDLDEVLQILNAASSGPTS